MVMWANWTDIINYMLNNANDNDDILLKIMIIILIIIHISLINSTRKCYLTAPWDYIIIFYFKWVKLTVYSNPRFLTVQGSWAVPPRCEVTLVSCSRNSGFLNNKSIQIKCWIPKENLIPISLLPDCVNRWYFSLFWFQL